MKYQDMILNTSKANVLNINSNTISKEICLINMFNYSSYNMDAINLITMAVKKTKQSETTQCW